MCTVCSTLLVSMGHGHCSNVIFNSLLDFMAHLFIPLLRIFLRLFFSFSLAKKRGMPVATMREYLPISFRHDSVHFIEESTGECNVDRENNLLSLKLWFTETTVHQNNKQKRQKKASISISIIISSTISLKLLLTLLSFAFLVLWSMWQDAFMSVLKCNNAKKTISYGRDSETTWKKANEQTWLVGWLNGSNDHPIKNQRILNILKSTSLEMLYSIWKDASTCCVSGGVHILITNSSKKIVIINYPEGKQLTQFQWI